MYSFLELAQAENLDPFGDGPQRTRSPSVRRKRGRGKQTGEVFNFCVSLCQCVLIFRTLTSREFGSLW